MEFTTYEFDHAFTAWAHIINKLDKTDLQALSTACRTAFSTVHVGDKVRFIGHEDDSGFKFGDVVRVTGVYPNSISAAREGMEMGYYISKGDYIGFLE